MRLLVAMGDARRAQSLRIGLEAANLPWKTELATNGEKACELLREERYDLLAVHGCLPRMDGHALVEWLWSMRLACPPITLLLSEPELSKKVRGYVDCFAPLCASVPQMVQLLRILSTRQQPRMSLPTAQLRQKMVRGFLEELGVRQTLKGHAYSAWILERMLPAPWLDQALTSTLYPACADAFSTTPAGVERCVRLAVEDVFTEGSMEGIERFFGSTIDPERGKPTNRAFLVGAASWLREEIDSHSLTASRSPNSMEMHHSPAAPMMV